MNFGRLFLRRHRNLRRRNKSGELVLSKINNFDVQLVGSLVTFNLIYYYRFCACAIASRVCIYEYSANFFIPYSVAVQLGASGLEQVGSWLGAVRLGKYLA